MSGGGDRFNFENQPDVGGSVAMLEARVTALEANDVIQDARLDALELEMPRPTATANPVPVTLQADTDTPVLAANPNREGLIFRNKSSTIRAVFVLGPTADPNTDTVELLPEESKQIVATRWRGPVTGYGIGGTADVVATEFTP